MANQVKNTPLRWRNYASRGLIGNSLRFPYQCIVQPDGTLWAVVAAGTFSGKSLYLLKSTDNGFTWEIIHNNFCDESNIRDVTGTNFDGPAISVIIDNIWRNLDVIYAYYDTLGTDYYILRNRFDLDDLDSESVSTDTDLIDVFTPDVYEGAYCVDHNNNQGILLYGSTIGTMRLKRLSPRTTGISNYSEASDGDAIYSMMANRTTESGVTHILYCALEDSTNHVRYTNFTESTLSYKTAVELKDLGSDSVYMWNPAIAYDGYDTLCAMWDENAPAASGVNTFYSTSVDDGVTWSTPTAVPMTSGHSDYLDPNTSDAYTSNLDLLGGQYNGFLMCYTRVNADSYARVYVRQLSTSDGSTYTLGDEQEVGTTNYSNRHIVGGKFFKPSGPQLLDLREPGLVRIALSVDQGDDESGLGDTTPVIFAQELLALDAYADTQYTTESSSWTSESADSDGITVTFNCVGGPSENNDFYTLGMTGNHTTRYINAFNRLGTNMRFLQFEPDVDNWMNDRSAYGAPTESSSVALFDPQSYSFPTPSISANDYTDWVEQDVRKLYLPANFYLTRTFLVNNGGFLKRTVWLTEFDGNQYEISQVVPRFIDNQICFYEANCYVVGPSRDPFARSVLPSET